MPIRSLRVVFAKRTLAFQNLLSLLVLTCGLFPGHTIAQMTQSSCTMTLDQEKAKELFKDGIAAFDLGNISTAERDWTEIRQCGRGTADWPKAVSNLALLESNRGRFDSAISYFEEVLNSHPNDKEAGGNLMQTNRNYSHNAALGISECYEREGRFGSALKYAWLAKTRYTFYSWCGTCASSERMYLNRRIAYLSIRASRMHLLGILALALVVMARRSRQSPPLPSPLQQN